LRWQVRPVDGQEPSHIRFIQPEKSCHAVGSE
jgi:hypothetical protein